MALVTLRASNGQTITVSEEAANSIYIPSGKYTKVSSTSSPSPAPAPSYKPAPAPTPAPTPTTPAPSNGGMVTIQFAGTTNTVPVGDLSYWKSRGWTEAGSTAQASPPAPSTANAPAQNPSPSGTPQPQATPSVDQSGWTQSMKDAYDAISGYVDTLKQQGKVVNPNITIDDVTIKRFTDQAKAELAPFYKQTFDQADADIRKSIEQIKQDFGTQQRDLSQAFGQQLESTQQNFADRGLTFSSQRDTAEQKLAQDYNERAQAAAEAASRQAGSVGTQAERTLGSSNLPSLDTTVQTGSAVLGKPGVYGFTQNTGSRSLFTPVGNQTGSLERQKLFDEQQRVNELTANERQLRASQYM